MTIIVVLFKGFAFERSFPDVRCEACDVKGLRVLRGLGVWGVERGLTECGWFPSNSSGVDLTPKLGSPVHRRGNRILCCGCGGFWVTLLGRPSMP